MSIRRSIRTTEDISAFIRPLQPALKKRIHDALNQIRAMPGEGNPLQRELEGYRSFKVGNFSIIYRVTVKEIEVVSVGPHLMINEEIVRLMEKQSDGKPR